MPPHSALSLHGALGPAARRILAVPGAQTHGPSAPPAGRQAHVSLSGRRPGAGCAKRCRCMCHSHSSDSTRASAGSPATDVGVPALNGEGSSDDDVASASRGGSTAAAVTGSHSHHSWVSSTRVAEELRVADDQPGGWRPAGGSDDDHSHGSHEEEVSHGHSHGGVVHDHHGEDNHDEALLQGGVSHGHSHGAQSGDSTPVTRGMTAVFRALGLLSLASKLRDSLAVVAAAWAFLVRGHRGQKSVSVLVN